MSMFFLTKNPLSKISNIINLKILISLVFFFILFSSNFAFAWSGFDYENNTTIEIGPGNLVRENLEIVIFDWSTDSYHDVEILKMESSFNGVRLEVRDLQTNKKRVFEMEN